jgi:diguanylate cyclase
VHTHDREQSFAKTALALMTDVGVAATPDNFELFYAYASGENHALTQVMAAFINAKKEFSAEILTDLKLRCLSGARTAQMMDSLGGNIDGLIENILSQLESSARDTADYKDTLSAATGQLVAERSPADVRKESMTDPLTHIANRKAFDEAIRAALAAVSQDGEAVTLLLCDIDHFKAFNDNWGHQTGDQVLRLVAACLSENVKGRDTAARYGGEEFAVLLRGTSLEAATHVANQIRNTVETKKLVKKSTGDILGSITISIGVAQLAAGETAETAVRRADACLYGAKHNGRNLVVNQSDPRMAALETSAA